jgi:hypothetical protein
MRLANNSLGGAVAVAAAVESGAAAAGVAAAAAVVAGAAGAGDVAPSSLRDWPGLDSGCAQTGPD